MQFFRAEARICNEEWMEGYDSSQAKRLTEKKVSRQAASFNERLKEDNFFFVEEILMESMMIGVIAREPEKVKQQLARFIQEIGLTEECRELKEVTMDKIMDMLHCSGTCRLVENERKILEDYNLYGLNDRERYRGGIHYVDYIVETGTKKGLYQEAKKYLSRDALTQELDRIYAGRSIKVEGHPVHYMIQTDDEYTRAGMYRILIRALQGCKRVKSRRFGILSVQGNTYVSRMFLNQLYRNCGGGTIVLSYDGQDELEDSHASVARDTIEAVCATINKYSHQVLTILCLPRECSHVKEIFYEKLMNVNFIEMMEDFAQGPAAKVYLERMAQEKHVDTDEKLFEMIVPDKGYLAKELCGIFDRWYSQKLKNDVYPQYREMQTTREMIKETAPKGSAFEELQQMTGLSEAKKIIQQAMDYTRAQKLFGDMGMKQEKTSMHMVFTGNPGTAKTIVARLYAQIMRQNHVLSKGHLVEVGRGDLVGKYVGWTAPTIQEKFKEARGGVLFIDEAYSLVDGRSGSYGDEAINTIVQEMENHREDVIVIFAGYPDKMEEFLNKNPGLRSRIMFHVNFEDYSTEELCEIASLMAKQKGLVLSDGAVEALQGLFDSVRAEADFGNGRYVRNAIEKARMAQASRLIAQNPETVTPQDIATICREDIEIPAGGKKERPRVGFAV